MKCSEIKVVEKLTNCMTTLLPVAVNV